MVQDPWLTADFIWKISGFTVILLIISWIFDHFKTDSRLTRRTVLSTGVVVLGYLFFRFLTVPNIEFNETAISVLFLISWILISFLIYKAVKPDMQKILKGIFSALISTVESPSICTPIFLKSLCVVLMSTRSGMLEKVHVLSVRSADTRTGRAAFFAPLTRTSP